VTAVAHYKLSVGTADNDKLPPVSADNKVHALIPHTVVEIVYDDR
jgi:hypothetical protein